MTTFRLDMALDGALDGALDETRTEGLDGFQSATGIPSNEAIR
jgi:hypothetical protein